MKRLLVTGVALVGLSEVALDAQSPSVKELIPKATAYAHRFLDRFTNIVAEERYEQKILNPKRARVLVSDFLLVKPAGDELWHAFRDVAEVDGQPVRDREDRLMKLFIEPSSNTRRRAAEIQEAGARHSLAPIGTVNDPLLVMAFLQRRYVDRFRFTVTRRDTQLGPDVRILRFVEIARPTALRLNANGDLLSSGSIWIEEGTGRVVKTELQVSGIRITTLFKLDEALGIDVPVQMNDQYSLRYGETLMGTATYGKFRRFQVKTEETIEKP